MKVVSVAIAGLLFVGCASRTDLLARLHNDLARVRTQPAPAPVADAAPAGLGVLRGASLADIRAALGPADCDSVSGRACFAGADLVFEFFKLEPNSIGGGPTLEVWGDGRGRCRAVVWEVTE